MWNSIPSSNGLGTRHGERYRPAERLAGPAFCGDLSAQAARRHFEARPARRRIGWNLLPPLTFAVMVALWWGAVVLFKIPAYPAAGPGAVFARIVTDAGLLWTHSQVTLIEILFGFGLTIVTAIPLGLLIALSALAKQIVYPPIMLMQLVPKIAVAPLFLVWLGFGLESKVLLTVLMTFFPLLLASISGFMILDDRLLYLTKSMGASSWDTFRISASRRTARDLLRHQDIGDDRGHRGDRGGIRRREQGLGYVLLRGRARWTSSSCSRCSSCSRSSASRSITSWSSANGR
jgi:hypothetical protein